MGPLIAIYGKRHFTTVTVATLAFFVGAFVFTTGMQTGYDSTTAGIWYLSFLTAVIMILSSILARQQEVYIVYCLSGMAGYYAGQLLFSILAVLFDWNELWVYYTFCLGGAALVGLFTLKLKDKPVLLYTSFVGSYIFTMAWTIFFKNTWPTSEAVSLGEVGNVTAFFWVLVGVLGLSFVASLYIQSKAPKKPSAATGKKPDSKKDDAFKKV